MAHSPATNLFSDEPRLEPRWRLYKSGNICGWHLPGMGKHYDLGSISETDNPTFVPVEGLGRGADSKGSSGSQRVTKQHENSNQAMRCEWHGALWPGRLSTDQALKYNHRHARI
jgi:hypothetical protein